MTYRFAYFWAHPLNATGTNEDNFLMEQQQTFHYFQKPVLHVDVVLKTLMKCVGWLIWIIYT